MVTELRKQKDEERKNRTRSKLLDACAQVMAQSGYHKTLISDIASAAEVGQGTFYRHFKSKRDIIEALLDRLLNDLLAGFTPLSDQLPRSEREYESASLSVAGKLAQVLQGNRSLVLIFLREGPSIDGDFAARLSATYDRFAVMAQTYLDHAIEHGYARPCDSELISHALVGMVLRLVERWLTGQIADHEVDQTVIQIVDFAFSGFGMERKEIPR